MTEPTPPLARIFEAVRERDVDLLILEELCSSKPFRMWWLKEMGYPAAHDDTVIKARHSWSVSGYGESDLVLVVANSSGEKYGLLIEVKIDAPPQPGQARRYRKRGEQGRGKEWADFVTCMAARETYLESYLTNHPDPRDRYGANVPLERISEWFASEQWDGQRDRADYKFRLLDAAISPAHHGSPPVVEVLEATQFAKDYRALVAAEFRELRLAIPPRVRGPRFVRIAFREVVPGQRVVHHFGRDSVDGGYVDLQIKRHAGKVQALQVANAALLNDDITLVAAAGSAAFRIHVPSIDYMSDAKPQADQIRTALHAVRRLHNLRPKILL